MLTSYTHTPIISYGRDREIRTLTYLFQRQILSLVRLTKFRHIPNCVLVPLTQVLGTEDGIKPPSLGKIQGSIIELIGEMTFRVSMGLLIPYRITLTNASTCSLGQQGMERTISTERQRHQPASIYKLVHQLITICGEHWDRTRSGY